MRLAARRTTLEDAVSGIVYVQSQSGTAALSTVVFSCFISFRCTMSSQSLRPKVIQLYKTLLHLGRDYPKGYDYFRAKLKNAFMKNKDVTDPEEIKLLLARGDYIIKELEALYMLRKYRTLKKRYYSEDPKS